jgi:molybdenum cofactor synthesis domain-containing protein
MAAMQQKTAAIVVIGNEILSGKSEDKNAIFLIGELYLLGVSLRRISIIPDDLNEIARAVRDCSDQFDFVFTSGGVGPTHDDLTIEGIARAFNRPVTRHPELAAMIRSYFGEDADPARMRMADTPEGSDLIRADGLRWPVLVTENVYVLPGVPELFRSKFDAIRERFRAEPFHVAAVYTREDEFDITPKLQKLASENDSVEIGSYPTFTHPDYKVKITIESKEAKAVERARAELLRLLNPADLVRSE